jgi:hypothetical protein
LLFVIKYLACSDPICFQALGLKRELHPIIGHWKIGKLNSQLPDRPAAWLKLREEHRNLLDSLGTDCYIKETLTGLTL